MSQIHQQPKVRIMTLPRWLIYFHITRLAEDKGSALFLLVRLGICLHPYHTSPILLWASVAWGNGLTTVKECMAHSMGKFKASSAPNWASQSCISWEVRSIVCEHSALKAIGHTESGCRLADKQTIQTIDLVRDIIAITSGSHRAVLG